MAYIMEYMTVKEMEEALQKIQTVIIPYGCVEQHGYHLPLSTDIHYATEVARRAADRLDAVIAPTIPYTYSGGELPGTINVSPNVFSLYLSEICSEFVRMGFKKIVVYLGHGGTDNTSAVRSALGMLLRRNPHLRDSVTLALFDFSQLSKTWSDIMWAGEEKDFHAGWVETALMMYWKPELVRDTVVVDEPEVARMLRTDQDWYAVTEMDMDNAFIIPNVRQRKEVKIGVMGFPEKATKELGKKISMELEDGLVDFINKLNKLQK